jgi:hypothetical protein
MAVPLVLVLLAWLSVLAVVLAACRVAARADARAALSASRAAGAAPERRCTTRLRRRVRARVSTHPGWGQAAAHPRRITDVLGLPLRTRYGGLRTRVERGAYLHPSSKEEGNEQG